MWLRSAYSQVVHGLATLRYQNPTNPMNRTDRLFAILLALQATPTLRAADLAVRFEVSERTIYRDMQTLSESGIPIAALPGEGYQLLDGFHLPPLMLSPDEATALFLGGRMLARGAQGSLKHQAEAALGKVEAVLPPDSRRRLRQLAQVIDVFPAQQPIDWDDPQLVLALQAIEGRRVLAITYRGYGDDAVTKREVEPGDLTVGDGALYVNGYCRLRRDLRSFRLNRIQSMVLTGETFTPRMMIAERQTIIEVVVRFADTVLSHVHERPHYGYQHARDDGALVYHVHDLSEIRGWLLGFGSQAEVIAPDVLRSWLRDEAQRLIQLLT